MSYKFNPFIGKLDNTGNTATFDGVFGLTPITVTDQNTGVLYEGKMVDGIFIWAESANITNGLLLQTGDFMLTEDGGYLLQE